ncbi:beta-ketoacyl synthase N-terminal-like domain-containing protein [Flavobacterium beibuense]|uniref:3-oxoacyl-(Acyl-carrier-protein) synthase-like protein n=1 Tax=Flavobacterium beibuense TaxID=657326 RepID=A0A444WD45_9FLAO|nr:beta-ketoacyl synthase N-terminal-like domain-containing protein [Flavobacterium beibuense]RYJ43747.1 3-oxoacyl-(Acyl-carrier-protein) synthase-like protein [Flavobacterium beibuense]
MKKCYINGVGCVSAQKTFGEGFLDEVIVNKDNNVLEISQPDYKEFIAPAAGRRMAKGVKNGIVASAMALKEAGLDQPDAIITGTGMGCVVDSEKFLKAILDNNEEFLTPTSFIQSTHNTVGGQIALGLQCKAYNFTYVNGAVSFESALIDAQLQIDEGEANAVLTGGVEEAGEATMHFLEIKGNIKSKGQTDYDVLTSTSKGSVFSEGAVFFVLSGDKQQTTYAELKDVAIYNVLDKDEVEGKLKDFLKHNNLDISDIDAVVLGYNGDVDFDGYYNELAKNTLSNIPQLYYKHLSGEFNTASAFGLWLASQVVKKQYIPSAVLINSIEKKEYKNIVLYNQYKGKDHSFTLVSKC